MDFINKVASQGIAEKVADEAGDFVKGTVSKVLSGGEGQKDEEKGGPLSFLSSLGEKKDDDSSSGGGLDVGNIVGGIFK